MNNELTKALRLVLGVAETRRCSELHHKTSQFHDGSEACPVEEEIEKAASTIREWMLKD